MQSNSRPIMAATMLSVVCALVTSAFGQITVTSPTNNSDVAMPVQLTASFAGCSGTPAAFGYSIGSSPFITWGSSATTIHNTDYRLSSAGTYVIHFKGWGSGNPTPCETNINVTVTGPTTATVSNIELNTNYKWVSDAGTNGTAAGTTSLVSGSPCQDSQCREFAITSYTNYGGMRWSTSFGSDPNHVATHFIYDAYIYFTNPADVQNVEMDTNQVWDSANDVLILGTQCATVGSGADWEFTTDDIVNGKQTDTWNNTDVGCPLPGKWSSNAWHHAQIVTYRDGSGNAYYETVLLDGVMYNLNKEGYSSFSLNWAAGDLVLNFQIDGKGASGSVPTFYVDELTEIYW